MPSLFWHLPWLMWVVAFWFQERRTTTSRQQAWFPVEPELELWCRQVAGSLVKRLWVHSSSSKLKPIWFPAASQQRWRCPWVRVLRRIHLWARVLPGYRRRCRICSSQTPRRSFCGPLHHLCGWPSIALASTPEPAQTTPIAKSIDVGAEPSH